VASSNKQLLELNDDRFGAYGCHALLVNFHSVFPRSDEQFETFFDKYLQERLGVRRGQVVILQEGNTAYGQSIVDAQNEVLTVSYPLNISQMRAAYERQQILRLPVSTPDENGVFRGLELPLEQNPSATDLPQPFSQTSAARTERVVISLLQAVKQSGRPFVGLSGSSTEDNLFLAQLIRFFCPDVHLFCLDNHLLYAHPKFNRYLEGMIIASPFPLYPKTGLWTENRALQSFPGDEANGTYLACRVILARLGLARMDGLRSEYGSPFATAGDGLRPPLWISQVGRNAIMPVGVIPWPTVGNTSINAADDYSLRLDEAWQSARLQALQERAKNLGIDQAGQLFKKTSPGDTSCRAGPMFTRLRAYDHLFAVWTLVMASGSIALWHHHQKTRPAIPHYADFKLAWDVFFLVCLLFLVQLALSIPVFGPTIEALNNWAGLNQSTGAQNLNQVQTLSGEPLGSATFWSGAYRFVVLSIGCGIFLIALWSAWREIHATRHFPKESSYETDWPIPVMGLTISSSAVMFALIASYAGSTRFNEYRLMVERAGVPFARLSPMNPLAVTLAGFVIVLTVRAARHWQIRDSENHFEAWRGIKGKSEFATVARGTVDAIQHQAALLKGPVGKLLSAFAVILCAYALLAATRLTMLSTTWEWALRVALYGLALVALLLVLSTIALANSVHRLLDVLDPEEWKDEFNRLPDFVRDALKQQLFASVPEPWHQKPSSETFSSVKPSQLTDHLTSLELSSALAQEVQALHDDPIPKEAELIEGGSAFLELISARKSDSQSRESTAVSCVRAFLVPRIAALTLFAIAQLRWRLLTALTLVMLFVLALDSYPFQPHRALLLAIWLLAAATVGAAIWIVLSLNASRTFSAMAKMDAGLTLDWQLVSSGLLFGVVPLLTILSLHFPEFATYFDSAATAVKSVKP
jgi:hypothetical protein